MALQKFQRKQKSRQHGSYNHRRSCWRKTRYVTEEEAQAARAHTRRWCGYDGLELKVYFCTACRGWHMGHEQGWRDA